MADPDDEADFGEDAGDPVGAGAEDRAAAADTARQDAETIRRGETLALIRGLRNAEAAEDGGNISAAYRAVFNSDLGRAVLAHHAFTCGVGRPWHGPVSGDQSNYQHGQQDAAINLADLAGFDRASIVLLALTDQLEGQTHGGSSND